MTSEESQALIEMLTRTRDELRQVSDWLRTKEMDRGMQRVPALFLRLSSMADELLLTVQKYARKTGTANDPWWQVQGYASHEEALAAQEANAPRLPEGS